MSEAIAKPVSTVSPAFLATLCCRGAPRSIATLGDRRSRKAGCIGSFGPKEFFIYIYMLVFFCFNKYIYICICTVYVYNVCVCIYIYGLYLWPLTLLHVIIHGLIWDSPNATNLLVPFGDDLGMVYEWVYHIIYIT